MSIHAESLPARTGESHVRQKSETGTPFKSEEPPKLDENGVPIFSVPVFVAGSGIKDSITIKVSGDVKGLSEFTVVKITNLIAQTWEVGDNHGVSFKADRIEVVKAAV